MVSLGSKFLQNFRNLRTDAVPQGAQPKNINNENPEANHNAQESNNQEEIIIESEDNNKDRKKKQSFFNQKKKKTTKEHNSQQDKEPTTPVNTRAMGNVINIVNSSEIRWGNEIVYNFGPNTPQKETENVDNTEVKKTKSIMMLMEATIKPEHEYIDYISKNLGKNWHSFFKSLGYSKGRIETMEIDEARNGVSEARYKLLLDWVRNHDVGTLGCLATMLWQEDEKEIVKELAVIYKTNE